MNVMIFLSLHVCTNTKRCTNTLNSHMQYLLIRALDRLITYFSHGRIRKLPYNNAFSTFTHEKAYKTACKFAMRLSIYLETLQIHNLSCCGTFFVCYLSLLYLHIYSYKAKQSIPFGWLSRPLCNIDRDG